MAMQIKFGVKNYRLTLLLQSILKFMEYDVSSLDGDFGSETDKAVRQFQDDHELLVDGVVGEKTWQCLLSGIEQSLAKDTEFDCQQLGVLSARWESNGNPAAIGNDKHGGFSYGMYQISTRMRTMDYFLQFLKEQSNEIYDILIKAGGSWAAGQGDSAFQQAWKELAKNRVDIFTQSQHKFIATTHFYPLYNKLLDTCLKNMNIGHALKNVIWSVAVQHGAVGGLALIKKSLIGYDISNMNQKEVIARIYEERSKVDVYFKGSTINTKKAVRARFDKEKLAAIELLEKELINFNEEQDEIREDSELLVVA